MKSKSPDAVDISFIQEIFDFKTNLDFGESTKTLNKIVSLI